MKPGTTKPLVAARRTVEETVSARNIRQTPTPLGPQLEDPRREAIATAAPVVVAAAVAAATEVHLTASAEELVVAATTEAEATRTTT
jgi:hypothetical protein